MKFGKRSGLLLAILILGSASAQAVSVKEKLSDYGSIMDRNAFGLKPPPAPEPAVAPVPAPEPEPPPNIELTGITKIDGVTRAHMLVQKQGEKNKLSFMFKANEIHEGIKVVSIDPAQRKAGIMVNGRTSTLSIKTNNVASATPAPPRTAGRPPQANQQPDPNNSQIQNFNLSRRGQLGRASNSRMSVAGGLQVPDPSTGSQNSLRAIPTRNLRIPSQNQNNGNQQPPMTQEESIINVEVQRELNRDLINAGVMPPLPPTPLTSDEDFRRIVSPPSPGN